MIKRIYKSRMCFYSPDMFNVLFIIYATLNMSYPHLVLHIQIPGIAVHKYNSCSSDTGSPLMIYITIRKPKEIIIGNPHWK